MQRLDIREIATGRWRGILASFGLTERELSGKHGPCPCCGGKDRFRFDDKDGRGTFYCNGCGPGDGIELAMRLSGLPFKEVIEKIESIVGTVKVERVTHSLSDEDKLRSLRTAWCESKPLLPDDDAMRYLRGRGLEIALPMPALRLHPSMPYCDGPHVTGRFTTMVALVSDRGGNGLTLHRTYLQDGKKAPVSSPKKLMPGRPISGGAIRLFFASDHVGIAEGIETALAAHKLFDVPTWSCISTAGIESFLPPDGIRRVTVFADNDENFAGQKAAMALANRLALSGIDVDVKVPPVSGDWLDVLNRGGE